MDYRDTLRVSYVMAMDRKWKPLVEQIEVTASSILAS